MPYGGSGGTNRTKIAFAHIAERIESIEVEIRFFLFGTAANSIRDELRGYNSMKTSNVEPRVYHGRGKVHVNKLQSVFGKEHLRN